MTDIVYEHHSGLDFSVQQSAVFICSSETEWDGGYISLNKEQIESLIKYYKKHKDAIE